MSFIQDYCRNEQEKLKEAADNPAELNRFSFTCPTTDRMVSAPAGSFLLVTYHGDYGGHIEVLCPCGKPHYLKVNEEQ